MVTRAESGLACQMTKDEYRYERDELVKGRDECFEKVDEAVFKWSAGAFALTITFIKLIGMPESFFSVVAITATWGLLIISMAAYLISFIFARRLFDLRLELLNENYKHDTDLTKDKEERELRGYVDWCNGTQVGAFILSCIMFLGYTVLRIL